MVKRIKIIAVILIISLFSLGGRIFYIAYNQTDSAAVTANSHVEYYGSGRGLIYDKNLLKLVETQKQTRHSVINPAFSFEVPQRYANNQLCPHLIGYTDAENNGVSGIEKDYNAYLKAIPNRLILKTYQDARGKILAGKGTEADTSECCTNSGVVLTIDSKIQSIVQTAGKKLGSGSVIVMDSVSGDILALASFPAYNPNHIAPAIKNPDKPLINRALYDYNIGSVFKAVVCLAALESGIKPSFSYNCTGKYNCGGKVFHCHKETGHGPVNMKEALAFSCNTYFITLARHIGYEKILEICRRLEIDKPISLSDSIIAQAGNLPHGDDLSSPAALANFSFGQGQLLATPICLCRIYAAIHNGGYLPSPRLVLGKVMNAQKQYSKEQAKRVLSKEDTSMLMEFLSFGVRCGTGQSAAVENCAVAGKTATAQTGKFVGSKEKLISYFIGLFSIKSDKYTVLVMHENGISGSVDCAPVFKEICQKLLEEKEE